MKKFLLFLTLLVSAICLSQAAETLTFDFSVNNNTHGWPNSQSADNAKQCTSSVDPKFKITFDENTWWQKSAANSFIAFHSAAGAAIVIAPYEGKIVTAIEITYGSTYNSKFDLFINSNTTATGRFSFSSENVTTSKIEIPTESQSVDNTFKIVTANSSKRCGIKKIVYTVVDAGTSGGDKKDCGIAFTSTSDNVEFPGTDYALPFTNTNKVDVTFTSSNEAVATVANESNMPKLTIKGIGTTTITASFKGNADYKAKEVTFTLTVKKAQVAYLVTDASTLKAGDVIIIAAYGSTKAGATWANVMSTSSDDGDRFKTQNATFNTDKSEITTISNNFLLLELEQYTRTEDEKEVQYWAFKTLNLGTNGYLGNNTTTKNYLRVLTGAVTDNSLAKIEITDNVAKILLNKGTTPANSGTKNINWLQYNQGSTWYSCYGAEQTNGEVYIYKVTDKPETVETQVCGGSFAKANSSLDVEFMFTTSTTAKQVAIFMNDVMVGTFDVSHGEVDAILNNAPYLTDAKFKMRPVLESESVNGVPTPTQLGPSEALEVTWPTLPTFEVTAMTPKWYYQKFYTEAGETYANLDLWIYLTPSVTTTLSYTFAEFAKSVAGTEIWGWYDENKEQLQNCKYNFLKKVPVTDNIPIVSQELLTGKEATATFTPVFLFNVDSKYSSLISGSTRAAAPALLGEETPILVQEVNGTKISESIEIKKLSGAEVSGVESVVVEGVDGAVEYYNMQGVRVEGELAPGMYIRRQGRSVSKVQIR